MRTVNRDHVNRVILNRQGGADVNATCKQGHTALFLAAWNRYDKSIYLLLAAGADVNVVDFYGSTPMLKKRQVMILNTHECSSKLERKSTW